MLRRETHSDIWYGKLKEKDHLEDLYPDGRICYVTSFYTVYVTFYKIWVFFDTTRLYHFSNYVT